MDGLQIVGWLLVGALIMALLNLLWYWVKGRQGWCWVQEADPELRRQQHLERHVFLHSALDELVADLVTHTSYRPSNATVLQLLKWSWAQCGHPEEEEEVEGG